MGHYLNHVSVGPSQKRTFYEVVTNGSLTDQGQEGGMAAVIPPPEGPVLMPDEPAPT
jgi:hypothetical protein